MKELSVFIDESGDFGAYEHHSPFYIVALVFHDQAADISSNISHLNQKIRNYGFPNYTIHTGPLIRREDEYFNLHLHERKQIFNAIYNFARTSDIKFKSILVEKKQCIDDLDLINKLSKQLSGFLRDHMETFIQYDRIVCYYDYGQRELTHILVSVFSAMFNNAEFKKVMPANYKLSQAADLLCTMELLSIKSSKQLLSKSEFAFFKSVRDLNKSYLRALNSKKL